MGVLRTKSHNTSQLLGMCQFKSPGISYSTLMINYTIHVYIYIPRTQMTLVLIGKGLALGGWPSKIEVIWVPGTYTSCTSTYGCKRNYGTNGSADQKKSGRHLQAPLGCGARREIGTVARCLAKNHSRKLRKITKTSSLGCPRTEGS